MRQKELQLGETVRDYEPARYYILLIKSDRFTPVEKSTSSFNFTTEKNVTKIKMNKIRVVYLEQFFKFSLPTY